MVVTGRGDRSLTDLVAADFEILEDGQPQPITHFARAFTPPGGAPAPTAPEGPAPFPDEGSPRGRYIVLAVDDYHMEPSDLDPVRKALARFIEGQLEAGEQAAVVATSGSLAALQQFTADRGVLLRAVDRLRAHNRSFRPPVDVPHITDYQAELIESGDQEALSLAVEELMRTEPRSRQNITTQMRNEQRVRTMARQIASTTAHVTSLTLASLERIVRGLTPLRGRKVVVFFSSGFFLGSDRRSSRHDLEGIADGATRAGVVVYTVDARGLIATPAIGDAGVGATYNITANPGTRERIEMQAIEAARNGMNALAVDTGGLPLFGRNDMDAALKQVLEDSASYYRLGYEPRSSPRDGRFKKIEVRVPGRSGIHVRTASGYFAQAATRAAAVSAAVRQTPAKQEEDAARLLRTALDSSFPLRGLPVELAVDFVATKEGEVLAATAWLDAGRLLFRPTGDGREAAALDVVGVVVDEAGKTLAQLNDRLELSLLPETKERVLRNGLTYRKTLAVRPGLLQTRLAVREEATGALGSASQWVEVPDRARQALALSSIVVTSGDEGGGTLAPASARGAVSFDRDRHAEVARRFRRGEHLDYLVVVYERRKGKGAPADVVVEKQILSGSKLLTQSAPSPLADLGSDDARAEGGRLRLDAFTPGDYELRIVATDRASKATATRSLRFAVE